MIVFAAIPVGSGFSISARYAFVELTTLDDYYVVTFVVWYAYCYVDYLSSCWVVRLSCKVLLALRL